MILFLSNLDFFLIILWLFSSYIYFSLLVVVILSWKKCSGFWFSKRFRIFNWKQKFTPVLNWPKHLFSLIFFCWTWIKNKTFGCDWQLFSFMSKWSLMLGAAGKLQSVAFKCLPSRTGIFCLCLVRNFLMAVHNIFVYLHKSTFLEYSGTWEGRMWGFCCQRDVALRFRTVLLAWGGGGGRGWRLLWTWNDCGKTVQEKVLCARPPTLSRSRWSFLYRLSNLNKLWFPQQTGCFAGGVPVKVQRRRCSLDEDQIYSVRMFDMKSQRSDSCSSNSTDSAFICNVHRNLTFSEEKTVMRENPSLIPRDPLISIVFQS